MPKAKQKTSGRRSKPPSSGDSDSDTPTEQPQQKSLKQKADDQNRNGRSTQQNGSRRSGAEQNRVGDSDEEIPPTPSASEGASIHAVHHCGVARI